MAKCKRFRPKNRRICRGDLNKVCTLWDRALKAPKFDETESGHDYSNDEPVFCAIETVVGVEVFNQSNELVGTITHKFYILKSARVISTASTRIEYNGQYFGILRIQNVDENDDFLRLDCANIGLVSQAANK
jgi:head-tail adaptor